ncbi:hypothetical protein HOG48_03215 [Candidatus Peregrinibacteria bacterium]|jgi:hypothetical protein|nr:hypothetical protein [Candidatus Peregrinibacteria bacterium]
MNWKYLTSVLLLLVPMSTYAATADLSVTQGDVYLSNPNPVNSKSVRIYTTIHNNGSEDALGSVRFYKSASGEQIGSDQPISLIPTRADDVFVDWRPKAGHHTITIEIIPWSPDADNPGNNMVSFSVFVDHDPDLDGVGNINDIDDDNDGIVDTDDLFPLDKAEWADNDGDGIGNNADTDDDNDEVLDAEDALPLDPTESIDTDGDEIGNNADDDDDGDNIPDTKEDLNNNGNIDRGETDPLNPDSDFDGANDGADAFPLDETETSDFDNDGTGDNADSDDDDDGIEDSNDINPNNQGPIINAGGGNRSSNIGNAVVIDASQSEDPDGEIAHTVILVEKLSENTQSSSSNETSESSSTNPGGSTNGSSSGSIINTDGTINLDSIESLIGSYFRNFSNIIQIEEEGTISLSFSDDTIYQYIGDNLKAVFTEPGSYKVTVIAEDDKGETRNKEIIVNIRDYNKIFKISLVVLLIMLAIAIALKYILRAQMKRSAAFRDKKKKRKKGKKK